jgi:predicted GNAT superfamily acetyltransferase
MVGVVVMSAFDCETGRQPDVIAVAEETILRDAIPSDWLYIDSLRKKEGNALGFIPKDSYMTVLERKTIRSRDARAHLCNRVVVTTDNNDLTGFCFASFGTQYANIFQIVVQQDARRWHRALLMADEVEREAKQRGNFGIKCRVAYDLESNYFWRAIGYVPEQQVVSTWLNQRESKSKRPLWVYLKRLHNGLFTNA